MDNAQKAIMIGVGLFIAIIIISAVLLITNLGTGLIDDAKGNLSNISTQLQNQLVTEYDAKIIQGSEALAAVRKYYTDNKLSLVITNDKGTTTSPIVGVAGANFIRGLTGAVGTTNVKVAAADLVPFGTTMTVGQTFTASTTANPVIKPDIVANTNATRSPIANFTNVTDPLYINPLATYNASVIRHRTTNAVIGIVFQKI